MNAQEIADKPKVTGTFKWEVEPHPYEEQYDTLVTNDDQQALKAIKSAAEMWLWDSNEGGTRTLKVTHNPNDRGDETELED